MAVSREYSFTTLSSESSEQKTGDIPVSGEDKDVDITAPDYSDPAGQGSQTGASGQGDQSEPEDLPVEDDILQESEWQEKELSGEKGILNSLFAAIGDWFEGRSLYLLLFLLIVVFIFLLFWKKRKKEQDNIS